MWRTWSQLTQKLEQTALICSAWQQAQKDHSPIWTRWSCMFIYCCLCSALASLSHSFTYNSISVTVFVRFVEMCSSAQMSMRRFTLWLHQVNPRHIFVFVFMTLSHDAKYTQHKPTQGKYANWFWTNHLFQNKAKRSSLRHFIFILSHIISLIGVTIGPY